MCFLDAIRSEGEDDHLPVDMVFDDLSLNKNSDKMPIRLAKYKERIYSIVHSGYDLLVDSKPNVNGTMIDGKNIRGRSVRGER